MTSDYPSDNNVTNTGIYFVIENLELLNKILSSNLTYVDPVVQDLSFFPRITFDFAVYFIARICHSI